jgi:hypothetical protein
LKFEEKKNYAGSEDHSPHQLRKRSHFGTEIVSSSTKKRKGKINGHQEGCRLGLKPAPD